MWWSLWLATAHAGELGLDEAIDLARKNAPDAAVIDARSREAQGNAGAARSALLPQIVGVAQYQRNNEEIVFPNFFDPAGDPIVFQKLDAVTASGSANQVLFAPAAFGRSIAADAQSKAAGAQADASRMDLSLLAARYWVNAASAHDLRVASEETKAAAEKHLAVSVVMRNSETLTEIGLDRAKLQVTDAERLAIDARRLESDALGQLAILTGRSDAVIGKMVAPPPVARDAGALEQDALATRPEVLAARAQLDAAKAGRWTVVGDWAPTITANAAIRATNNPGITGQAVGGYVGATATLPIFDGGLRFSDAKRVDAQVSQAEALLDRAERSAREDVASALRGVTSARQGLEVARQREGVAAHFQEQTETTFQNGGATPLDVEDAQNALLSARAQRIQAEGAVILAELQLRRVTGAL